MQVRLIYLTPEIGIVECYALLCSYSIVFFCLLLSV